MFKYLVPGWTFGQLSDTRPDNRSDIWYPAGHLVRFSVSYRILGWLFGQIFGKWLDFRYLTGYLAGYSIRYFVSGWIFSIRPYIGMVVWTNIWYMARFSVSERISGWLFGQIFRIWLDFRYPTRYMAGCIRPDYCLVVRSDI